MVKRTSLEWRRLPGPAVQTPLRQAEPESSLPVQQPRGPPLLFWTGWHLGALASAWSRSQPPGGGLLCAGVICEGLEHMGTVAGFTRNSSSLNVGLSSPRTTEFFRYHLTNQTQVTLLSTPAIQLPFHFKGPDLPPEQDHGPKTLMGAGSQLSLPCWALHPGVCRSPLGGLRPGLEAPPAPGC